MLIHSLPLGKASHSAVALIWLINGQAHSEPSQPCAAPAAAVP